MLEEIAMNPNSMSARLRPVPWIGLPQAPVDQLDALERELDEKLRFIPDKPEPKAQVFGDDSGLIEYTHKLKLGTTRVADRICLQTVLIH